MLTLPNFLPPRCVSVVAAGFALAAMPIASFAQTESRPHHIHYERPPAFDASTPAGAPLAPRLQNLGDHTFPVSTAHQRAQLFINQGVNLSYAFNHAEAERAFAEAARLDPTLAMAYWGQALVLGPNINAAMAPELEPKAHALAQKAVALKSHASPREQAYIDAVAARYTGRAEDRARADRAYAAAMQQLAAQYPDDADAQVLAAEAVMDLMPWRYFMRDGVPYADTERVLALLGRVIEQHPRHPGALHLWIHVWESTDTPERAEAEADRLLPLMPGAGHIVHMPAHIYQRVGRHADVIRVNQLAARADEEYIAQCRAQGLYPLSYYPHNLHFIWMGAAATGQKQLALESARTLAAKVPASAFELSPGLQGFVVVPYWTMVRFEEWDAILAEPEPAHRTLFTRAAWHYARARALAARDRLQDAERELQQLTTLVEDPGMRQQPTLANNDGYSIMRIAPEVVAGDLAARRADWATAIRHFERGIRYEDALIYTEPHDWYAPVRLHLAEVLMAAGRFDEAETVYWEDLKRNANSGWALRGLAEAIAAQGRDEEAALVKARFTRAWEDADFSPRARRPATAAQPR